MSATSLSLPARAKLNLVLRIVGRRQDGYHLLDTLFHALELHDDLVLSLAPQGIALTVTAEHASLQVAPGPDNLVERALRRFADAAGYRGGFAAQLHKRIPHGGGLGGGSSDAAAALRLANELLGRPLADAALAQLGVALGADVPFFFRGGSQWGRGIGDELSPANVPPRWFVLLVPPFGCPTVDVYKRYGRAVRRKVASAPLRFPTPGIPQCASPSTTTSSLRRSESGPSWPTSGGESSPWGSMRCA